MSITVLVVAATGLLAGSALGGGLYEATVLDPVWPGRPAIVQPRNGGVSRRRFWIPVQAALTAALIAAVVLCWSNPVARFAMLVGLASHVVARTWSALDAPPGADRADPASVDRADATRWTRRSRLRLVFDAVTCAAALTALAVQD